MATRDVKRSAIYSHIQIVTTDDNLRVLTQPTFVDLRVKDSNGRLFGSLDDAYLNQGVEPFVLVLCIGGC